MNIERISVELEEFEVLGALRKAIAESVDRCQNLDRAFADLPRRSYQVDTLRGFARELLLCKLEKIAMAITRYNDLKREASAEFARAFDGDHATEIPQISKQKIRCLDQLIVESIKLAHAIAAEWGYCVRGGFEPSTGVYGFGLLPMSAALAEAGREARRVS